ncbi:MAG: hypothetical protein M1824_003831 [Vezdaea acicularis]|nr:MAG: hypothetical protein M1824_003831 [Vezdaea acicularis]
MPSTHQPQRPLRSLRIHDENSLPGASKTIHSRHKSTGALLAASNVGASKATVKRAAFGEISNSSRALPGTKDDSAIPLKAAIDASEKLVTVQEEKATAPLLRPAQRPLSVSGLKNFFGSNPSMGQTKQLPTESQVQARKVLTKRNTTIFKDAVVPDEPKAPASAEIKPLGPSEKTNKSVAQVAPVHQDLAPRHAKSQQFLRKEQPVLRKTKSKYYADPVKESAIGKSLGINISDIVNVGSTEPVEQVAKPSSLQDVREVNEVSEINNDVQPTISSTLPSVSEKQSVALVTTASAVEEEDRKLAEAAAAYVSQGEVALVSEPEEYWEDDENDDEYDEEGYTTARSYRSKDNTTGGMTAIMFPKQNAKVRKELAEAKVLVESTRTVEEIEDESWDTTMVAEYGDEIFAYMKDLEADFNAEIITSQIKMLPDSHYMDYQSEIQWSMRSVLMDWLVQVHHRFNLLPETLFLTVNYIDRFLTSKVVSLGKLQLVGATAIFVAAKYEEITCPSVQEIVYMVDGGYSIDEILKAERFMLSMLKFELGWPGPMSFLRRISKADDYDLETRTLAKYFLEVTIMDERFVASPPSYLAAGAHCLARELLRKGEWTPHHVYYSEYTYSQIRPLLLQILDCCENPQKHHTAVYDKYADRRFKRASVFVETELAKGFVFPMDQPKPRAYMASYAGVYSHVVA